MSDQANATGSGPARTVVVLGAGVGGLCAAQRLRELLPGRDQVVLIDRSFDGVLGLSLLWVLRGWRQPERVRFRPATTALPGVEMIAAEAKAVEPVRREVITDAGEIKYDALIVAAGAALDTGSVPGLTAALTTGIAGEFYTPGGAALLNERLRGFDGGQIALVIAGMPYKCPAAPYEGAMLAADLLGQVGAAGAARIDIFTPEPLPMPVAGAAVGESLVRMLDERGIGFHPAITLDAVDAGRRRVEWQRGGSERFDLLIVVPPHRPPEVAANLGLSPAGWLPVEPRTLATGIEGVWAIGDVALLTLPNGKPLPKAAVFAEAEAEAAAAGVARYLGYQAPEPWFSGDGYCIVEAGGEVAAKGGGNFLTEPDPRISLHQPSAEFHQEKAALETTWLNRWNR